MLRHMIAIGLCIALFTQLNGQPKEALLEKGVSITSSLVTGDTHKYTLKLEADQFIFVNLYQDGIDAALTLYNPDGSRIGDYDSPNYRKGDEPVSLFTDKKGDYILEVKSIDAPGHRGNYRLTWEIQESKGTTPEKQIDQLFSRYNSQTPGASVAVARDGKIIFQKGYGSAALEYDIPITPTTVFHIASVSKQFTAFAILMLENDGKLSVNDDVRKYIPEVPDFGKVITLKQLIHHTSGLRDQWELLGMAGWRLDDIITTKQILNLVSRQKELNFTPGDEMVYCNTGYTLLAEVVARVSGMSFAAFTRTRIFEPLKMNQTLFYDDCEKLVKNRAYSFYQDSSGYKKSILSYSTVGATSLFTTSADLCRWAMNFEKPLVGQAFIDKMAERGVLNNGDTLGYAMGQGIHIYKGLRIFEHGGADAGYRSNLLRVPDQHFSVNVLSNFASFNPGDMASKIMQLYLADKLKTEPAGPVDKPKQQADSGTVAPGPEILQRYCGRYEVQPGLIATITLQDNNLFAEAGELPKTKMIPLSPTRFEIREAGAEVTFVADEQGRITKMMVMMQGQEITAMRLPDFDPARVDLAEFTGEYFSDELNTTYTLVVESGKLIARHFRTGDIHLKPVKADGFTGNQWFFGQVEMIRDNNKSINGFMVSTGRVRNLKFVKQERLPPH